MHKYVNHFTKKHFWQGMQHREIPTSAQRDILIFLPTYHTLQLLSFHAGYIHCTVLNPLTVFPEIKDENYNQWG